jgi:hypothetical protein
MSYLEKLKSLKTPTQVTVLTALSPFGSKGSTPQRHFPAKKTLRAVKAVRDGGIFQENDPGTPTNGQCLICGGPLVQNGRDCFHVAFHLGLVENLDPLETNWELIPKLSTVAITWLLKNRQELKRHGWSMAELYRRNISPGILFSPIWSKPFLKVTMLDHGAIEFEFVDAGRDCTNVARPMRRRNGNNIGGIF